MKELGYVFKVGDNDVWLVIYATAQKEFERRLPTFERSAETIRVTP
jgi:hypothetical protein